jgi:hypothetical protein
MAAETQAGQAWLRDALADSFQKTSPAAYAAIAEAVERGIPRHQILAVVGRGIVNGQAASGNDGRLTLGLCEAAMDRLIAEKKKAAAR